MSESLSKQRLLQIEKEDLVTMYLNLNRIFEACSSSNQSLPLSTNVTNLNLIRGKIEYTNCQMEKIKKQADEVDPMHSKYTGVIKRLTKKVIDLDQKRNELVIALEDERDELLTALQEERVELYDKLYYPENCVDKNTEQRKRCMHLGSNVISEHIENIDSKPTKATDIENIDNKPMKATDLNKPMKATDLNKPMKATDLNKPMKAIDLNKPMKATDLNKPMKSTYLNKPMKPRDVQLTKYVALDITEKEIEAGKKIINSDKWILICCKSPFECYDKYNVTENDIQSPHICCKTPFECCDKYNVTENDIQSPHKCCKSPFKCYDKYNVTENDIEASKSEAKSEHRKTPTTKFIQKIIEWFANKKYTKIREIKIDEKNVELANEMNKTNKWVVSQQNVYDVCNKLWVNGEIKRLWRNNGVLYLKLKDDDDDRFVFTHLDDL